MAKPPDKPRDPAKHSKKDPARPTRSKAHRPDSAPTDPALERLLLEGRDGVVRALRARARDTAAG